jgi:simple sugar transport system substrate-binding protein
MSKKLLNLLLVIMMLAVLVPTALASPPAQEGQDYVVVADDWLSKLADKYLGNPLAYPAIVDFTNQKHAEDASYAEITDPDLIEVGWKIYIPSAEEAAKVVAEAPAPEKLNFIMVQHALCAWDSFWCTVEQGIADGAEDIGVNVTVLGPDEFNLEKTATLIDQAVAAQPDGIALTVTDPVLFKEPIMRALDAGIPVLAYNAGSGPVVDGIPYMAYLGQDEYQGGYLGGLRLAAEGGTSGVCINQQVGHTGLDARCQGFVDALDEKGIPAEVLAVGDDLAESQTIIDDYFTANPDVDIALTLGPNGATPFYAFLDASGLGPDDVTHGTFDLNPEIVAAIENGTSMFGIDQQPFLQGYGAVMMLMLLNRQNIVPALPVTPTGPGFVDKSNVAIVKALAGEYR